MKSIGDLAGYSVQQEAAITVCDGRRAALVSIIEAHSKAVTPKPWWRRLF